MPYQEETTSQVLEQFRTALNEEVGTARQRASNTGVTLSDGRHIGQMGANHQYVFKIEDMLSVPADSPAQLQVPGQNRMDCVIVSVEGLTVVLSVPSHLGAFVPQAFLHNSLADLLKKLAERIDTLEGAENPVGERIRVGHGISGKPEKVDLSGLELTEDQERAVASSLGCDATYIWGPPGTGKTRTIGTIAHQLMLRGRSVLLVSHTNTAVDQAMLRIGDAVAPSELAKGAVIRVGEPRDRAVLKCPDLLLDTHVAKRRADLSAEARELKHERATLADAVAALNRLVELAEWLPEAITDVEALDSDFEGAQELGQAFEQIRSRLAHLQSKGPSVRDAETAAGAAQENGKKVSMLAQHLVPIQESRRKTRSLLIAAETRRDQARTSLAELGIAEPGQPAPSRQAPGQSTDALVELFVDARVGYTRKLDDLAEAEELYSRVTQAGALVRMWRRLPSAEYQARIVDAVRDQVEQVGDDLLDLYSALCQNAEGLRGDLERIDDQLMRLETEKRGVEAQLNRFQAIYEREPAAILEESRAFFSEVQRCKDILAEDSEIHRTRLRRLNENIRSRLDALRTWGLIDARPTTVPEMLDDLHSALDAAAREIEGQDVAGARCKLDEATLRITAIDTRLQEIEAALKLVEAQVIGQAVIVGTTLTRAYLRDTIQGRRFDTVILDEASMAPIPALWVAASLADSNAVVVGDFRQLPPIVLSDHPAAKKWLGRDIFEVAGKATFPGEVAYRVDLREQHRMHPQISEIPNTLFYGHQLRDGASTSSDSSLDGWYQQGWGHDTPVLLVDTGKANAWVTPVKGGGGRASRLNFLSATMCIDLAEQVLREDRKNFILGDHPRILLICPYRPHANLMKLLLRESKLEGEVEAGTAHMFQGSEADVVILDLVNDEPHFRVGMFTPDWDEGTRRLLNVALTRAKLRLMVVGDFDYIRSCARKAFLGRDFVPFLDQRYPRVDVLDIVPSGLAARAARGKLAAIGGRVEPEAARLVVTQDHFFPMLLGDMDDARTKVVIYSPFITPDRLAHLEPHLKAMVDRGVRVVVITKTPGERGKREAASYQACEIDLLRWGVSVIHKYRMHEKLVFIDEEVLWSGSLNPLSYSNTQEVMERRRSADVVRDYASKLRVEDLTAASEKGSLVCPACEHELIAREGAGDPFFYKCEVCGYSRNVDQPPPTDGEIRCPSCGGELEFGHWGSKLAWRCVHNRRHRAAFHRSHLSLPKMLARIPAAELGALGLDWPTIRKQDT